MTATAANLAPLLEDPDGGVRECAAECMGHLKEAATSHLAAMRALMKEDREESVRDAAMDAMTRLGFYNPLSGALKQRYVYFNARMVIFGYFWLFLVILVIVCGWAIRLTSCFVQLSQGFLQSPAKSRAHRAAT